MKHSSLVTLTLLSCLLGCCCGADKVLRFHEDGTFKLLQFTDMHFGEDIITDDKTHLVQSILLDFEHPDLVVMTGDAVNVNWAFTFGNHDDQADLNRSQILSLDATYPLSLTQTGPSDIHGATNYHLFIYSSNVTDEVPVVVLYFFDSSDTNCEGVQGWGCVYPDQIAWYTNLSASITQQYGKVIPAMAFFHIPVPEFMYMWNNDTTYGNLQDTGVCCFSVNTGLFAAFQQMGDVISVHCGHDHDNDFFGSYGNVLLAYGRKTGYGGYGPPSGWERGARILQLSENPFKLEHWIRQQYGSKVLSSQQPVHPPTVSNWTQCCGTATAPVSNCAAYLTPYWRLVILLLLS